MHFVSMKRFPRQANKIIVAEPAGFVLFFDLLCCFGFHGQIAKTLYCSKLLQKQASLRNLQQTLWSAQQKMRKPEQFVESINKQDCLYQGKALNVPTSSYILWSSNNKKKVIVLN